MGSRPTKRVFFDHSDYEDKNGNLQVQMIEKLTKRQIELQ